MPVVSCCMKRMLLLLPVALCAINTAAFSQANSRPSMPTSLSPGSTATTMTTPAAKKKSKRGKSALFSPKRDQVFRERKQNVKHTARYEFYERVEKAAREKQKILKKLAKPQYSDPRYFGHKRIPKKRPPHKMRYCGECSLRH